jgi:hypothetical protein
MEENMILRFTALVIALLISAPYVALAQDQTSAAVSSEQLLKSEELDALVAPIALYPDALLSLVLMASTYPLEVVQADRWAKAHKNLKGDQLKAEVDKQSWDDSVKSLVATPDVLSMMSEKLDWTQKLGDAVLAQQPDVMDAIQRLRTKAETNNKLASTEQQKVTKKQEQGKEVIVIEPTEPNTIYVPYYEPAVVYGVWPYPLYPPYYFAPPGYIAAGIIRTGIEFGAGYALGRWASGGNYWGGGCNWHNNNITINRPININRPGSNWQHRPEHRHGVRYRNASVQQRYGNNTFRAGAKDRMDFRGRGGQQVLRPGGGQANLGGKRPGAGGAQRPGAGAGQRPGAGGGLQRPSPGKPPSAGQRPSGGKRPSAGQRPSGGKRPSAGQRPSGGKRPTARRTGGRGGGNALGNISSGRSARARSARGRASLASRGGGGIRRGGGRGRGGGGRGGGGRRSDIATKHDIVLLGRMPNGIGFYRFSYNGGNRAYVGVLAQEVQAVMPEAVMRGDDGYLRVFYDRLGIKFQTYEQWIASGAHMPESVPVPH